MHMISYDIIWCILHGFAITRCLKKNDLANCSCQRCKTAQVWSRASPCPAPEKVWASRKVSVSQCLCDNERNERNERNELFLNVKKSGIPNLRYLHHISISISQFHRDSHPACIATLHFPPPGSSVISASTRKRPFGWSLLSDTEKTVDLRSSLVVLLASALAHLCNKVHATWTAVTHQNFFFFQKKNVENSKLKDMQRVPHSIPFWIKTVLLEMVLSKQSRNYCLPKASGRFASGCLDLNPWLTKTTMQQQTWHTTAPRPCSKTPTCHLSDAGSPCSWFLKSIGLADHAQVDLKKKNSTNDMSSWQKNTYLVVNLHVCPTLKGLVVKPEQHQSMSRKWKWRWHSLARLVISWKLGQRFQLEAGGTDRNVGDRVTLHHCYSNAVTLVFMHQNIFRNPVSTV